MEAQVIQYEMVETYRQHLIEEEKSRATVEKYIRDIWRFYRFLAPGQSVTKELIINYKQRLLDDYKIRSANSMLVSINCFFTFLGWTDFRIKTFKYQQELMVEAERELLKEEYQRLLETAKKMGKTRLYYILQTICATGIRISELPFITFEAVQAGQAQVNLKGKTRTVILPKKLCRELLTYCKHRGITGGHLFITRTGKPVDRSNVWREMKQLSEAANVNTKKAHPHSLRHLFARTYYQMYQNIVHLADVLGHSSINTTRIYTSVSRNEHEKVLNRMNLVA